MYIIIGITEQTDESIRLFHGLHGGSLYSDEVFSDDERHLQYPPLPASESRFQSAVADLPDAKRRATIAVHDTFDYFDEEVWVIFLCVCLSCHTALYSAVALLCLIVRYYHGSSHFLLSMCQIYLTALEVFERQKIRVRQMTRISGVDLF